MSGKEFLNGLNDLQRRIVDTLDTPVFVEAGAGSGKTFTLTKRVAWALSKGSHPTDPNASYLQDISEVLVITFTNAAAREIKERLRSSLRDIGLTEAALRLDDAWISTIHAMCGRILKRYALELGIDPLFVMLTERDTQVLRERAYRDTVTYIRNTSHLRPILDFLDYQENKRDLQKVLDAIAEHAFKHAREIDQTEVSIPKFDAEAVVREILETYRRILDSEHLTGTELTPSARKNALEGESLAEELLTQGVDTLSWVDMRAKIAQMPFDFRAKPLASEKQLLKQLKAFFASESLLIEHMQYLPQLRQICVYYIDRFAWYKRQQHGLDNNDLILFAYRALTEYPHIAEELSHRFKLVMIDEFQDTDALQLAIVSTLAGTNAQHLCTVGDAQQSIYRFRGADVSIFYREREKALQAPKVGDTDTRAYVQLDCNYRSHDDILRFVDKVCMPSEHSQLMDEFMSLKSFDQRHAKALAEGEPRIYVEVTTGPKSSGHPSQCQRHMQAERIAEDFERTHASLEPGFTSALLLGTMTNADVYLKALRARGLSCVISGGSTFSASPEVGIIVSALTTLANLNDGESGLFALLESEMFSLDADDFALLASRLAQEHSYVVKRSLPEGFLSDDFIDTPSPRLNHALVVLRRAFERLDHMPIHKVLEALVYESGWMHTLLEAGISGEAQVANIEAALRYVQALSEEACLGVVRIAKEFDAWLQSSKLSPASFAGERSGQSGTTIEVMTIHASKGLEYDICAVAEMWSNPRSSDVPLLYPEINAAHAEEHSGILRKSTLGSYKQDKAFEGDLLIQPFYEGSLTAQAATLIQDAEAAELAEKARLLYVGLTRAREVLILGILAPQSKEGTGLIMSDRVLKVLELSESVRLQYTDKIPEQHISRDFGGSATAEVRMICEIADADAKDTQEVEQDTVHADIQTTTQYRPDLLPIYEVQVYSEPSATLSFSQLKARLDALAPGTPHTDQGLPIPQKDSERSDALSRGSSFHELAQILSDTSALPDEQTYKRIFASWKVDKHSRKELQQSLEAWAASKLYETTRTYDMHLSELAFCHKLPEVDTYLEGYFDLWCSNRDRSDVLIVDYKTGDLHLTEEEVYQAHFLQASLYAYVALSQGASSVRCAFVCVERLDAEGSPLVVEYSYDELSDGITQALELINIIRPTETLR